jgi:uncharacterized protein (TIGR02217 family)
MAFYESPRFPERISYGAVGGAEFNTIVAGTTTGREVRESLQAYPKQRWDVSQGVNGAADFKQLRAFFWAMRGKQHGWRFKDWTDFEVDYTEGIVTGLTSTTFQLVKRYSIGGLTMDRIITKPVTGTVAVQVSGTPTAATVNTVTGVITIGSAPSAANVTWAGEFDCPMRFDTDHLQGEVVARNLQDGLLTRWAGIPIVEVPV